MFKKNHTYKLHSLSFESVSERLRKCILRLISAGSHVYFELEKSGKKLKRALNKIENKNENNTFIKCNWNK